MQKVQKTYTQEFKREAVRLAQTSGKPIAQVARELGVHTSLVEPLPHQITAVYGEMLTRQPLRFLLADDPGAGKTIMIGLFIKELLSGLEKASQSGYAFVREQEVKSAEDQPKA
jgi:Transposase